MPENWTRPERLAMLLACGSPGSAAAYHGLTPRFEANLMQRNEPEAGQIPGPAADSGPKSSVLRAWFNRLTRPFGESIWQRELRARETYLADAQNPADVEVRLRALERAALSRHGAVG